MTEPLPLTDRDALSRHRTRARATGSPALFLHEIAADDVEERLGFVNRTFQAPAVVTPFPELWQDRMPSARLIPDNDTLDLQPGAHDLVIHAMALHWANDPIGQLIQCRRALRPDGLLLAAFPGGETLRELRDVLQEAEVQTTGGLSPRVAPMTELRDAGGLLQRAGFSLPVADSATTTVRYRSMIHLIRDLRAMGETNALASRHKLPPPRAMFVEADARYTRKYGTTGGGVVASFEIVMLTGWSPDESQPKPLRPGSATTRLADALDTDERALRDDAGSSD